MKKITAPALASGVTYQDHNGNLKAGIVLATPATVAVKVPTPDELATLAEFGQSPRPPAVAPLDEGQVILQVISPASGRTHLRRCQLDEITGYWVRIPEPVHVPDDASELDGEA
jgi:hypothetical protein